MRRLARDTRAVSRPRWRRLLRCRSGVHTATPIRAEGSAVRSLVVTVRDFGPLAGVERMRPGFLDLVSHELREPLAATAAAVTTLLEEAADRDPVGSPVGWTAVAAGVVLLWLAEPAGPDSPLITAVVQAGRGRPAVEVPPAGRGTDAP